MVLGAKFKLTIQFMRANFNLKLQISDCNNYEGDSMSPTPDHPVIDTTNINEKLYNYLKEKIIDGTYSPGERLRVRELGKLFGVSQTPLKDAFFRLSGEGFVDISSRRGTYVKEVTEQDIIDIFDTRIILETGAAELVAGKLTDAQISKLKSLYEAMLRRGKDINYKHFFQQSSRFHTEIIRFTGNNRLLDIYRTLNGHIHLLRFRFSQHATTRLPGTDKEHLEILNAFQEGNPQQAKIAIRQHLLMAKKSFLEANGVA
jgi:DNA-binding GntR family transcriptional regulator